MTSRIGGHLDYARLARLNAPKTHDELRIACVELRARGFHDYDIASATSLSVEAVRRMLGEAQAR